MNLSHNKIALFIEGGYVPSDPLVKYLKNIRHFIVDIYDETSWQWKGKYGKCFIDEYAAGFLFNRDISKFSIDINDINPAYGFVYDFMNKQLPIFSDYYQKTNAKRYWYGSNAREEGHSIYLELNSSWRIDNVKVDEIKKPTVHKRMERIMKNSTYGAFGKKLSKDFRLLL